MQIAIGHTRFRRAWLWLLLAPVFILPATAAAAPGGAAHAAVVTPWVVQIYPAVPCDWDGQGATCTIQQPFAPAIVVVREGDTVEWRASDVGGHTVTVPAAGALAPPLYTLDTLEDGSRLWRLNPLAGDAQGGPAYDGTALAGSGILHDDGLPYRLTFTRPGRYTYVDLAQPALPGQVIVLPATAGWPQPDQRDE